MDSRLRREHPSYWKEILGGNDGEEGGNDGGRTVHLRSYVS